MSGEEVDPFDPHRGDEHTDEHEGQETWFDTHDDNDFRPSGSERNERIRRAAIEELRSKGFNAPTDLYYVRSHYNGEAFFAVSEDRINWYRLEYGFESGRNVLGLIPKPGTGPAPDSLWKRFEDKTVNVEEMTEGPAEYLKKVFDKPRLEGFSYGTTADGRVWVSLEKANSVKYFINEDGTAENVGRKVVNLPKTLKDHLGKTIIEVTVERDEKIKQNREKEERLKKLKDMNQENIELREMSQKIKDEREEVNRELQESKKTISELTESLRQKDKDQEELGVDMANLITKKDFYEKRVKELEDELINSLSNVQKIKLTTDLQMMRRELEVNTENVNQKQAQLDQAARDIDQQRQRITELEMQKEEFEATIAAQRREIERNAAQVEQNEREIGDQDLQEAERERQELERENEQLEEQNQEAFERLSLKEKVKAIFRKYGVTVVGVLAAVGTIIGVIVSNLKAGLSKVATGVGNGLKEIGKKLGQILPGMVGAIVSFLFKAAGSAIGFLAKNSWLLILLVVTFAVDQFKAKKGSEK